MPTIVISMINASSVVTDAECQALCAALQRQVTEDFAPAWGIDAALVFVAKGGTPAPGSWWLSILDNTDQAGVAGHHEVTPDGQPVGQVFAGTDKRFGLQWTVTASHELLEMLADPDINLTVFSHRDAGDGMLYAYEVCDACQDDAFAYEIDGIKVCDFVYPAYFETFRSPGSTKFDHQDKLKGPVPAVLSGGYINSFDINAANKAWHPISAATVPHGATDRSHLSDRFSARRDKRQKPRSAWRHSTAFQ